ncbi:hypothetical protein J2X69_001042 [Algoriphagus sp. 4150]|uniref:hypothetical protein n=1 Tax=Algoriphagus sp. 4150 TaxID=2817756 RepID=UPI0028577AD8|nr:hypothetical protein [Algoriphagus sp. 4150]MDR7128710.1 hypothetical protein [Algoriphagus sp. 4150]
MGPINQLLDACSLPEKAPLVEFAKIKNPSASKCQRMYGTQEYYLEVARANQLGNFQKLVPGQKTHFSTIS